jgi:hypothetical protein
MNSNWQLKRMWRWIIRGKRNRRRKVVEESGWMAFTGGKLVMGQKASGRIKCNTHHYQICYRCFLDPVVISTTHVLPTGISIITSYTDNSLSITDLQYQGHPHIKRYMNVSPPRTARNATFRLQQVATCRIRRTNQWLADVWKCVNQFAVNSDNQYLYYRILFWTHLTRLRSYW